MRKDETKILYPSINKIKKYYNWEPKIEILKGLKKQSNIMKNKPIVSIIMNCFNGERYLSKSLKSLKEQKFKNWELIFWDNCSTDKSKKIFLSYKDKRFKYFKSKRFLTLYEARNLAIKKSKGKYISFLDVDDWWHKDKLKLQVNFFSYNKKLKIIYTNYFLYFQNKNYTKIFLIINYLRVLLHKNF